MFKAALSLAYIKNITIDDQPIGWFSGQTGGQMMEALRSACSFILSADVFGIIGPGLSPEAHLLARFADKIGIPIISYGATDSDLSDRLAYPTFYRTVPSDKNAAMAVAHLFLNYNWSSCVIIYQNDAFGSNGAKVLTEALVQHGFSVEKFILFDLVTMKMRGDLKAELMTSGTRIIIVWAHINATFSILKDALLHNLIGPQYTWILSSRVPFTSFNEKWYPKLVGILIIEPSVASVLQKPSNETLLNEALILWRTYEPETYPNISSMLSYYSLFAFDATWMMVQALSRFCRNSNHSSTCLSMIRSSLCFDRLFEQSLSVRKILDETVFLGTSGLINFATNSTDRQSDSFYSLYNVQPSMTRLKVLRVLDYSNEQRWTDSTSNHVIIWPGNTLRPPSGRSTLQGVRLRICVFEAEPFTIVRPNSNYSDASEIELTGYVPDMIETLRERMGFIADIRLASNNGTYSGLVQAVADDEYDIFVGDVTVTAVRREIVGFSNAIFDNSLRILMRKSSDQVIDLTSVLKPFSLKLWWLVFGTCIYAGIVICLVERTNNEALQNHTLVAQLLLSIWYAFGNMVGYGVEFHASTAAGRLMTTGLYILSLILVASYTANLASELTISKTTQIISSIDDLKNGKIPLNRIGIREGTAAEDFYRREIPGGDKNFYPLQSQEQMYESLLSGSIDAALMDTGVAEYITSNIYCNLTLVDEGFDKSVFGIVMPKAWIYAQELDVNILFLRESGYLDNLKQKWFHSKNCPSSTTVSTEISIESVGGLFLTFAIISLCSIFIFVWAKRQTICRALIEQNTKQLSDPNIPLEPSKLASI